MKRFAPFLLLATTLRAAPPLDQPIPPVRIWDTATILDGNNVACFVNNAGNVAYDRSNVRGRADGFYFPDNWPSESKTVIYDAGLWLAGVTTAGDTLVAVAEYSSEYAPGAMGSNPTGEGWRVYSISQDPASWSDWPDEQGAPMAADGQHPWIADLPDAMQMQFTVFNEGDPSYHTNDAGSTGPMGVEVRLTAWCSQLTTLESTVFLRWELLNQGAHEFSTFFVGFWLDPDLGGAGDDLVGFEHARQMAFVYNADEEDTIYGPTPPALGAVLLYGPHAPAAGDSAFYQDAWHADETNRALAAFSVYTNGTDPHSHDQTLFNFQGLDQLGHPRPNGVFDFLGDPVDGWGNVDTTPADKRMLLSCAPVTWAPGEHQEAAFALTAAQGANRLGSVTALRELAPQSLVLPGWQPVTGPLHFENVPTGTTQTRSLAVYNPSSTGRAIDGAAFSDPQFSLGAELPIWLSPQDTTSLVIQYQAPDLGARSCLATFAAGEEAFQATMSANGPWIQPSLVGDLGPVPYQGQTFELIIENTGTENLIISGADSRYLSVGGLPATPIAPGASATFQLIVTQVDSGPLSDILLFTANTIEAQAFSYTWRPEFIYHWQVEYVTVDGRPAPVAGIDYGGPFFGGGITFGEFFRGSTMPPPEIDPDSYHDIRVTFGDQPQDWTQAAVYHRPGYNYAGAGAFPGQAWRGSPSSPTQRLNVCFVENTIAPDSSNGLWDPSSSELGGREYLFIMNSEYNGGIDYNDVNNGTESDVLWAAWVRRVDEESAILPGDELLFTMTAVSPVEKPAPARPSGLCIASVHPNPFNPAAQVELGLARPATSAQLQLYNLLGQLVWSRDLGPLSTGTHTINLRPEGLPSGLYLLRAEADGLAQTTKVLLVR